MHINTIASHERAHLLRIAIRTGLFNQDEAESLLGGVLDGLAANAMPLGHQAYAVCKVPGAAAIGWCYLAPDDHAAGVWNLWWLGVDPKDHGTEAGRTLLAHAEELVLGAGGRLLVIETSDSDALSRARSFYAKSGYKDCGRIPDFYAKNESKVIFARSLPSAA